jgi:hypothetical protein
MPAVLSSRFHVDEVELHRIVRPRDYGEALGRALFIGSIRDAFARSIRGGEPLHVMLSIDAPELRPLIWERLCGPQSNGFQFLGLDQRVAYSRYIPSPVDRETRELRQADLRALVVVACPDGLGDYGLAPFDPEAAAAAVRDGMRGIRCDFLGPVAGATGRATLDAICEALTRSRYTILHVVAHGRSKRVYVDEKAADGATRTVERRETLLFLEKPTGGSTSSRSTTSCVTSASSTAALPHLVFFAACESGVESGEDSLGGLARGLVGELGIPAVLAMSSRLTIATAHALTRAFYARLQIHGHVDEALVEAGAGLIDREDALVPALYSRLGPLPLFLPEVELQRPGAPEPEWTDPDLRAWSMTLQRAFAMRERLKHAGQATELIDSEISSLRLRLRKDGDLHAGDMLGDGRYLLLALFGEGLTASVWKAHDRVDSRLVAIKTLHPQLLRRDGIVRQFRRGAERMQTLDHPNIVRVLTLAEEEDRRLFFVMELMPGGTLKELIRTAACRSTRSSRSPARSARPSRTPTPQAPPPRRRAEQRPVRRRRPAAPRRLRPRARAGQDLRHRPVARRPGRVRRPRVPVAAPRRAPLDRRLRPRDDDPVHVRRGPAGRGAQRPAPLHRRPLVPAAGQAGPAAGRVVRAGPPVRHDGRVPRRPERRRRRVVAPPQHADRRRPRAAARRPARDLLARAVQPAAADLIYSSEPSASAGASPRSARRRAHASASHPRGPGSA